MQALIIGTESKELTNLTNNLDKLGFKTTVLSSLKEFDINKLDQEKPCIFYKNPYVFIENPKMLWEFQDKNLFKCCTIKKEMVSFLPKFVNILNDKISVTADQKETFEVNNLKFQDTKPIPKVAATYVVYENSGFLEESVSRIYPLVDKILFLLSTRPWNGKPDNDLLEKTYRNILDFQDPEKKMEIVSMCWATETEQRNFGIKYLEKQNIAWTWIIDDDEMYNVEQAKKMLDKIKNEKEEIYGYGVSWVIYWKNKEYCIDSDLTTYPTFIYNFDNKVYFIENRMIIVPDMKQYQSVARDDLVCHHYSYIRSDDKMFRKINMFSHKNEIYAEWYENVWLKWNPEMENLHPMNPFTFKKTKHVSGCKYKLEDWKPIK